MTKLNTTFGLLLTLTLTSGTALAQDADGDTLGDDLEVTMTMMPDGSEDPSAVINELALPTDDDGEELIPSEQGFENSAVGLETANAARELGSEFGQTARELAEDNRERFGRGGRAPELDELLPELPNPPEPPVPAEAPSP